MRFSTDHSLHLLSAKEDYLLSAVILLLLIWFWMYFCCSIWYNTLSSFSAFIFLFKFLLVRFLLCCLVNSFCKHCVTFLGGGGSLFHFWSQRDAFFSSLIFRMHFSAAWTKLRYVVCDIQLSLVYTLKWILGLILKSLQTSSYVRRAQL